MWVFQTPKLKSKSCAPSRTAGAAAGVSAASTAAQAATAIRVPPRVLNMLIALALPRAGNRRRSHCDQRRPG